MAGLLNPYQATPPTKQKAMNAQWRNGKLVDAQGNLVMQAPGLLDAASQINQFLPVTGDIQAGLLAANDVKQGNYGSAALNSLGLLPFVPAMGAVVKAKEPFNFIRNTQKSPKYIKGTVDTFGQSIEPAGRYMLEDTLNEGASRLQGWESGTQTFQNPKFIQWGSGGYADEDNWKNVLSKEYKGKKGKALSKELVKNGYDGIVTLDKDGNTMEIVDLSMFGGLTK